MEKSWNKKEISREEKRLLRKLFFQKQSMKDIEERTGLTQRIIYRHVRENKWIDKRERYWLFIIKMAYNSGRSVERVCEDSGVISINILRRIKQKYRIKTKRFYISNKRINENIERSMIRDYENMMSSKKVAIKYGFKTHKTVIDVLNKFNIDIREPKIITYYNTNYFEKIDSHDKAYILGFLLTDGYVIRDYNGIAMQLNEDDGYILERISQRLGRSTTIIHIDCSRKREYGSKNFRNARDMKRMSCFCPSMANDLKKYEMVKNKTLTLEFPSGIPKKYLSSFCRGLWDGDGTVGIAKTKNIWCQIVSASPNFLYKLSENIPFLNRVQKPSRGLNLYALRICGGNRETKRFLKWIYKYKSDLYLERKYAKVQNQIS